MVRKKSGMTVRMLGAYEYMVTNNLRSGDL